MRYAERREWAFDSRRARRFRVGGLRVLGEGPRSRRVLSRALRIGRRKAEKAAGAEKNAERFGRNERS